MATRSHKSPHQRHVGSEPINIVMTDDDQDDQLLMMLAAEEAGLSAAFTFLDNGLELLTYLERRLEAGGLPNLLVLDLRMPKLDGHRTLAALQSHPELWQIPIVVFTSSTRKSDHEKSMEGGARWFETKPSDFQNLVELVGHFGERAAKTLDAKPMGGDKTLFDAAYPSPGYSDLSYKDLR